MLRGASSDYFAVVVLRSAYVEMHQYSHFGTAAGEGLDPANKDMFDDVAERNGVYEQIAIGSRREASGKQKALEPKTYTTRKFGEMANCVDVTIVEAADDDNNLLDFLGEKNFINILKNFQTFTKQLGAIQELHDHTFLNELHDETVRLHFFRWSRFNTAAGLPHCRTAVRVKNARTIERMNASLSSVFSTELNFLAYC